MPISRHVAIFRHDILGTTAFSGRSLAYIHTEASRSFSNLADF